MERKNAEISSRKTPAADRTQALAGVKKIVVKVGTHVIADESGRLVPARIGALARQVCELKKRGLQVILVTSGAIGAGVQRLGLSSRPEDLPTLQAAAAAGQPVLMNAYAEQFGKLSACAGQILLTHEDIRSRRRFLNARNTINRLLALGVVPVINENDTVAVEEIKFGDNDRLSALVASLTGADLLVLLSTVDGYYSRFSGDGRGEGLLSTVTRVTGEMLENSTVKTSPLSVGGMVTKLQAVRIVVNAGQSVVIANGGHDNVLLDLLGGQPVGTLFLPRDGGKLPTRKRWLAYFSKPAGSLHVDAGAEGALRRKGGSLLPGGVTGVAGDFRSGDTVMLCGPSGAEFGRGIAQYGADEVRKIRGHKTSDIASILGQKTFDEVVHRDNMVVFDD